MDDLSAALEVSSSNYSRDYFVKTGKNSCLVVFSGRRLTNYVLVKSRLMSGLSQYLATKSHVSPLLLHAHVKRIICVELKVLQLFIIIDLHRGPAIGRMNPCYAEMKNSMVTRDKKY